MDYLDIDAPYSFIGGGKIDHDICDGLIDFYQNCTYLDKEPGHHGGGIDKSVKDSTDLTVPRYIKDERVTRYIDQLAEVTKLYCDFYPQLKTMNWDLVKISTYNGILRTVGSRNSTVRGVVIIHIVLIGSWHG